MLEGGDKLNCMPWFHVRSIVDVITNLTKTFG